ncbi:unnamed protein product, partial [Amoebophrya sp. A25]
DLDHLDLLRFLKREAETADASSPLSLEDSKDDLNRKDNLFEKFLAVLRKSIEGERVFRFLDTRAQLGLYDDERLGQLSNWERVERLVVEEDAEISENKTNTELHAHADQDGIVHYVQEGQYLWWPVTARRLARSHTQTLERTVDSVPPDYHGQNAFHQKPVDTSLARAVSYGDPTAAQLDEEQSDMDLLQKLSALQDGPPGGKGLPPIQSHESLVALQESLSAPQGVPRAWNRQAFKVYVYDVDDPLYYPELPLLTRGGHFCRDVQWGHEVLLHQFFLSCACRTLIPEEADFFFVPQYSACHTQIGTFNYTVSEQLLEQLVPKLAYFPFSNGRDHIFVFSGGEGADGPMRSWRDYIAESIFIMNEPELWNYFEEWQTSGSYNFAKDILVPPLVHARELGVQLELNQSPADRLYRGDFIGWNRRIHKALGGGEGPRGALLRWMREDSDKSIDGETFAHPEYTDLHVAQDVPAEEGLIGQGGSLFCFIPRGISGYTTRFVRALFAGCVPVLLSDLYEVPFWPLFQQLFNSENGPFLIKWPMRLMEERELLREDDWNLILPLQLQTSSHHFNMGEHEHPQQETSSSEHERHLGQTRHLGIQRKSLFVFREDEVEAVKTISESEDVRAQVDERSHLRFAPQGTKRNKTTRLRLKENVDFSGTAGTVLGNSTSSPTSKENEGQTKLLPTTPLPLPLRKHRLLSLVDYLRSFLDTAMFD